MKWQLEGTSEYPTETWVVSCSKRWLKRMAEATALPLGEEVFHLPDGLHSLRCLQPLGCVRVCASFDCFFATRFLSFSAGSTINILKTSSSRCVSLLLPRIVLIHVTNRLQRPLTKFCVCKFEIQKCILKHGYIWCHSASSFRPPISCQGCIIAAT